MTLSIPVAMGLMALISLVLGGCHYHDHHIPPGQAKKVFVEPPGHAKRHHH